MTIVADFSKMLTMESYRNTITKPLEGKKISIFVANAGYGSNGGLFERNWSSESVEA